MGASLVTRRRVVVAAITFSGLSMSPAILRLGNAWAQANGEAAEIPEAMSRMARLLAPHDSIADDVYAAILDDALAATAGDNSFAAVLADAEAALDAQQNDDFMALGEKAQLEALRAVQGEGYFAAILGAVRLHLYNHPAVWEVMNYEGPSWQQGGYLNRGAGEIDWLPEAD